MSHAGAVTNHVDSILGSKRAGTGLGRRTAVALSHRLRVEQVDFSQTQPREVHVESPSVVVISQVGSDGYELVVQVAGTGG